MAISFYVEFFFFSYFGMLYKERQFSGSKLSDLLFKVEQGTYFPTVRKVTGTNWFPLMQ